MSRVKNVGHDLLKLKLDDETGISHSRSLDADLSCPDAVWLFPVGEVRGDGGGGVFIATMAHFAIHEGSPLQQGQRQGTSRARS